MVDLVSGLEELDFCDEIKYQQLVTIDRCTL